MKPTPADRVLFEVLLWARPLLSVLVAYAGIPLLIWHGARARLRRYRLVEGATA